MKIAYIAVGSNIDAFDSVSRGLKVLHEKLNVLDVSGFYLNEAVGTSSGQHEFLNGVVKIKTEMDPYKLKYEVLRKIEEQFGRTRDEEHYHDERLLDLDLILHGSTVVKTEFIQLPHPELLTRDFVYVPLLELFPGIIHPEKREALSDLVEGKAREMERYRMEKVHF